MKFLEIFRFEFVYQVRQAAPWLYALVLTGAAFLMLAGNYLADAEEGYFLLNAPAIIANTTVFCCLVWLLTGAAIAGEAAARDTQTRMASLVYTSPIGRFEYLGGRFTAAFLLNALVLLAIPFGSWLTIHGTGVEAELLGPFRFASYLTSYLYIALPNAFFVTAIQFSLAAVKRKAILAYLGSLILFVLSFMLAAVLFGPLKQQELGSLLDPIGTVSIMENITQAWSPLEINTRLLSLNGSLLINRLFWFTMGIFTLFLGIRNFRFSLSGTTGRRGKSARAAEQQAEPETSPAGAATHQKIGIAVPVVQRDFGFGTHLRQALAICRTSFLSIFKSRGGLVFIVLLGLLNVLFIFFKMEHLGVPFYPVTVNVVEYLATSLSDVQNFALLLIPLLIIYYAGELLWRDREAGISEITNAAPVPEWALFLGRFLGLSLILLTWLGILTLAGIGAQLSLGYYDLQPELYLQLIFGLHFSEYLLFVLLALVIHTLVDHKYAGHLVALLVFGSIVFASVLGFEHQLLIYGSDPGWTYTEMRGYAGSLEPWFWFKLYWFAWALLLALVAKLFWVRGRESGFRGRLKLVRQRFTAATALTAAVLVVAISGLGGYIFYNTNVLNPYHSSADVLEQHARYEQLYGRFRRIPQPELISTDLQMELYPEKRELEITGTYQLVNNTPAAIDSLHVAPVADLDTEISFNRPAREVLADRELGHFIFALQEPLHPGDTLELRFRVHSVSEGFSNSGTDMSVVPNGTFFTNYEVLPAVGYQEIRELDNPMDREAFGLPSRPAVATLEDVTARQKLFWDQFTTFEATVGTSREESAFLPGEAVATWLEGERRYFSYSTRVPIVNQYAVFSANYALKEGQWQDPSSQKTVDIQILHHPEHTANLDRILEGTIASLDYFSREFGPYPYGSLRFIERASPGSGLQSTVLNISWQEGFSYFNSDADPRKVDFTTAIVAHEVAHQWWGNQLLTARVEGSGLLSESLAWYTAMGVMEDRFGTEYQQRLLSILRQEYETPKSKADVPLLRGYELVPQLQKRSPGPERPEQIYRQGEGQYGPAAAAGKAGSRIHGPAHLPGSL